MVKINWWTWLLFELVSIVKLYMYGGSNELYYLLNQSDSYDMRGAI